MSLSPNNFVWIWMSFSGDLNLFNDDKTQLAIYCVLRFSCSFGPYTLLAAADPIVTKLNPIFYVCGLYIYIQPSAT